MGRFTAARMDGWGAYLSLFNVGWSEGKCKVYVGNLIMISILLPVPNLMR